MLNKSRGSLRLRALSGLNNLLNDHTLNSSLCLIFNGMASVIAIIFLIFFVIGNTKPLLWLGIAGCLSMTLANTIDILFYWLGRIIMNQVKKQ